jgi:hypothetical protein
MSQGKFYVSNAKVILSGAERLLKASSQVNGHLLALWSVLRPVAERGLWWQHACYKASCRAPDALMSRAIQWVVKVVGVEVGARYPSEQFGPKRAEADLAVTRFARR